MTVHVDHKDFWQMQTFQISMWHLHTDWPFSDFCWKYTSQIFFHSPWWQKWWPLDALLHSMTGKEILQPPSLVAWTLVHWRCPIPHIPVLPIHPTPYPLHPTHHFTMAGCPLPKNIRPGLCANENVCDFFFVSFLVPWQEMHSFHITVRPLKWRRLDYCCSVELHV